jgi:lysophospholipase L1-like esterase
MKANNKNQTNNYSRRTFFKNAGLGTVALAGLPLLANGCSTEKEEKSSFSDFFSRDDVVLFQGDSITDASRDKKNEWANQGRSFGTGYALFAAAKLLGTLPDKNLTIYNRGISGNKVYQLDERWEKDCIDLKPNVLSILIGVNDYWHFRNGKYDGTPEIYEEDFRKLLNRTTTKFPDIKLVICEPFILPDTRAVDESWLEPFRPYQEMATKITKEFNATWVPFQTAFINAVDLAPATYWTGDGVHPTMAGAQLMADTWLKAL